MAMVSQRALREQNWAGKVSLVGSVSGPSRLFTANTGKLMCPMSQVSLKLVLASTEVTTLDTPVPLYVRRLPTEPSWH